MDVTSFREGIWMTVEYIILMTSVELKLYTAKYWNTCDAKFEFLGRWHYKGQALSSLVVECCASKSAPLRFQSSWSTQMFFLFQVPST